MYVPKKIKTKNGIRWEVSFHVNGRGSKRIRRRFERKEDALDFLKGFFNQKDEITLEEKSDLDRCFYKEVDYWLSIRSEEISSSYKIRVLGILANIKESYPNLKVSEITPLFLTRIRKVMLQEGASPATVNRWTSALTAIINFSYRNKRIPKNLVANFKLLNEFRDEINYWEEDEVRDFLEFTRHKYDENSKHRWVYLVYLLALNTGLRSGEIWGLKVRDINTKRNLISIERQFLHRERKISATKGKKSRRVPCNEILKEELLSFIQKEMLDNNAFLFRNEKGNPIFHYNFRSRYFLVDLEESGVSKIRFHDLRHTALTLMVSKHINLNIVQAIAGHADIKTTMKYVHLLANDIENVSNQFAIS